MSLPIIVVLDVAVLAVLAAGMWRSLRSRRPGADQKAGEGGLESGLLHDDLTQLPNRTLFLERLERALARSVRRRRSCAVLSIDVDRFQLINDSLGPSSGDRLLREIAARLASVIRPEDTVARTGSDEFGVLLETVDAPPEAVMVAERIVDSLTSPFQVEGRELFLSVSMGIALGRGARDGPEQVIQNADVAVHRAKDNGRARFEVFRQEMNPHPIERIGLETDLRRAVERMDFELAYQPIAELATGRLIGVEALVHWRHPQRGLMGSADFVPIAEETGLILPLGRWVMREACAQAAAWQDRRALMLSVNLSARQLQQPRLRLVDEIASVLAMTGLRAPLLCLEISESAFMQDAELAIAAMHALRGVGVELALDDFGTGHSSLGYLRRLPRDVVKIDRSLTRDLTAGGEGKAVVRALIELCHALSIRVVGEGIESEEQARHLAELGCDLGQGSCLAKPLPPPEIEARLAGDEPLLRTGARR
jgi:diguanylate cyclase (GGDEF)-like protein